jgi:hypothetical protein
MVEDMVENIDDTTGYDRQLCGKNKDKNIFVKRLMKRSCEFPWGIVDQVTLGMLMETTDV